MRIRIKKRSLIGDKRIDSNLKIDSILVNENLIQPERESVEIFFKGEDTSGILNLTSAEARKLSDSLKTNIELVKTFEEPLMNEKQSQKKNTKKKKSKR